jgi:hypothetical protein
MSALGKRVAQWRCDRLARRYNIARGMWPDGVAIDWRHLSVREWWTLLCLRDGRRGMYEVFRCWAALPGDRFHELMRDRVGEVVVVKRDYVEMLVLTAEGRARGYAPHLVRIPRREFTPMRWWRL